MERVPRNREAKRAASCVGLHQKEDALQLTNFLFGVCRESHGARSLLILFCKKIVLLLGLRAKKSRIAETKLLTTYLLRGWFL